MEDPRVVNRLLVVFFVLLTVAAGGTAIYSRSTTPLIAYGGVLLGFLGLLILNALVFLPLMALAALIFGVKATHGNEDTNEEN